MKTLQLHNKISLLLILSLGGFGLYLLMTFVLFVPIPASAQTTCPAIGGSFGSASYTLSDVLSGNHRLWVRMKSPDGTPSINFSLSGGGSQCNQAISTTGASNWRWVQSSTAFTTSGGSVVVQIAGTKAGVGVDCFVLTSDTNFAPTTAGHCAGPQIDTTAPTVSFTTPAQNATLSGIVTSVVTASDIESGISQVAFSVSSTPSLGFVDTTAPYEYSFNTALITNSQRTITATATNRAGLTTILTRNVTIFNEPTIVPPPPVVLRLGDVNGDGLVNLRDFSILASNFGRNGQTRAQGDLNGDGTVGIVDFSILASNFGR